MALLDAQNQRAALPWFERAHRLAPDDPVVLFLLASTLSALDATRSLHLLEQLLARHPTYRSAHISRAALLESLNRIAEASEAIDRILTTMAVPQDAVFHALAGRIANAAGCAGWLGLTGCGRVLGTLSPLHLEADGAPIAVSRTPARRLPDGWRRHAILQARAKPGRILGGRIDIAAITRVEGAVRTEPDGSLAGWAFAPNDPDAILAADLSTGHGTAPFMTVAMSSEVPPVAGSDGIMQPSGFRTSLPDTVLTQPIHVSVRGHELLGSPWRAWPAVLSAHRQTHRNPTAKIRWKPIPPRAGIDVIIPLYKGAADFHACLASLAANRDPTIRIVCVDDAIADPDLQDLATQAAARNDIILLRHARNRGFPAAINTALDFAGTRDVILLNSDTLLPPGALTRLADAAYADANTGTVTPLTTDGTITTCLAPGEAEPMPGMDQLLQRDRAAARANPSVRVEIPTCVGFCVFIRHDCRAETGTLQDTIFAQGYCEENDFSLRATALGWRHVAACDVVVAHAGGRSFGPARHALLARNLDILNRLYPAYAARLAAFIEADSLRPIRAALARALWSTGIKPSATILVTHNHGGGVERHVRARIAAIQAAGMRAIVIRPARNYAVSDGTEPANPALTFDTSEALATFLRADTPTAVECHHLAYHHAGIENLANLLSIPQDIVVHDFAAICPQITLCSTSGRYCGEPLDPQDCTYCVEDLGSAFDFAGSVEDLRHAQRTMFAMARSISAPSQDTATRLRRYMPNCHITVSPPEDDTMPASIARRKLPRKPGTPITVAVVGALGINKGYNILLACARDAERRGLNLHFHIVGHTIDDSRLLATGHAFVSGPFQEGEAQAILADARAHVGFLPSVWPETWCYALSELWRARLHVLAFAIGNQADRIRATAAGTLLPLNAPPQLINHTLMDEARGVGGK